MISDRSSAHDDDHPKCPRCFHKVRVFRVRVMMGVYLDARIHVSWSGKLLHWGKLNPDCKLDEVTLHDHRVLNW